MTDPVQEIEQAGETLAKVEAEIAKRIVGQGEVVRQTLTAILSGGHALLVGVPGLAKTRLVETLGTVLGLPNARVQFTPDLMPADILGAEVLETGQDGSREFKFIPGPIFTSLLMADEINRASPRTQSALLQAMQEHKVTVAGQSRNLGEPFHVLATQNPIEQEGTYPLPEAQLDRFLLQIDIDYPDRDEERAILLATTGVSDEVAEPVLDPAGLIALQHLVRVMPVGEQVMEAILTLVRSARPEEPEASEAARTRLAWGPGPRAAQALMLAVRARALIEGRLAPSIADVMALAPAALQHRMALTFAARAEGASIRKVIDELIGEVSLEKAA
ncbi:MoxR family ATPase [Rhodobacteraceae bacterium NNCM2]|nr:MoxR family ATPase [Coraliihabitans acroporae]